MGENILTEVELFRLFWCHIRHGHADSFDGPQHEREHSLHPHRYSYTHGGVWDCFTGHDRNTPGLEVRLQHLEFVRQFNPLAYRMFDHWAHLGGAAFGALAWYDQGRTWNSILAAFREVRFADEEKRINSEDFEDL